MKKNKNKNKYKIHSPPEIQHSKRWQDKLGDIASKNDYRKTSKNVHFPDFAEELMKRQRTIKKNLIEENEL